MDKFDFEFGPVARGIYTAMLWLVILLPFVFPQYFLYYILLLAFLGLGLKPTLLKTGLYTFYQNLKAKYSEYDRKSFRRGYYKREAEKIEQREQHLAEMKRKVSSGDNNL